MTTIAGTILLFGGTSVPPGYLSCDGQAVSRATYATLFGVIGSDYGDGDGSTTFNLPDLNGGAPPPAGAPAWLIAAEDGTDDGTVTDVGLSTDAGWFTVSNSPVTTSGTLAMDLTAGMTANTVLATPDGTAGTVGLRSLVGGDLPDPTTTSKGGVLALAPTSGQWLDGISTAGVPTTSQPGFADIAGTVAASQLPNPTASTKGGVQSLAASASRWINTISTSGVPGTSQPAFSDLSGVAAPGQLPNPTSSTKGGVQAVAAVAHQWVNAISTSGVPGLAQPAFADIAGTVANSQLPANTNISSIGTVVDGGGFVLTTGQKGYIYCPFAGTITAATLIGDAAGSIVLDVWKTPFSTIPTDADSITASAPPTLGAAQASRDTSLTGWTRSVAAGDVFGFNIDSVSGLRRVALVLTIARS